MRISNSSNLPKFPFRERKIPDPKLHQSEELSITKASNENHNEHQKSIGLSIPGPDRMTVPRNFPRAGAPFGGGGVGKKRVIDRIGGRDIDAVLSHRNS